MVTSTTNRVVRTVDRAHELFRQIEEAGKEKNPAIERLDNELLESENRAVLLLRATRSFYFSLGFFAFVSFVSLLGAGLVSVHIHALNTIFAVAAVVSVVLAVSGLVVGSILLFY